MEVKRVVREYFVRHGESELNKLRVHQSPGGPLSAEGRRQVQELAQWFKNNGIHFDLVVTSTYERAFETAQILSQELAIGNFLFTEKLGEKRNPSEIVGKTHDEAVKVIAELERLFGVADQRFSDEENFYDLRTRAIEAWQFIDEHSVGCGDVLVVSHGGILKMMMGVLSDQDISPSEYRRFDKEHFIHNTGVIEIVRTGDKRDISFWDRRDHLVGVQAEHTQTPL